jgi:hypothetical protein
MGRGERGRLPELPSGNELVVVAIDRGTGHPVSAQAATRAWDERSRLARARVRFAGFELDLIERTPIAPGGLEPSRAAKGIEAPRPSRPPARAGPSKLANRPPRAGRFSFWRSRHV